MHSKRRELGRQFKEAAPPLFREYIYTATAAKYGDALGPTFEMLREKKTFEQIIESASRPIENLYRGLLEWKNERGRLTDTCLDGQDKFIRLLRLYVYDY